MEIISKISNVRAIIQDWKRQNYIIGFVPTMGSLHIGHESLIKRAKEQCNKVIVSIFVNPVQFGPNEDYNLYPRCMDKDREICLNNQVDLIFAPNPEEMYPELLSSFLSNFTIVSPPEFLKNKFCGQTRKGHFEGVATIVLKLFNIIQPDKAFFGQKDAQQLVIIKKICKDLNLPVEIIACPTVRDTDGLACSSRNSYLSSESRKKALSLFKALKKVEEFYNSGVKLKKAVLSHAKESLDSGIYLEYFDICDADTLQSIDLLKDNSLVLIAAKIDGVRLIDNILF
ncbi:MAG: pantoate--beta-alanine ligase [bacterium]